MTAASLAGFLVLCAWLWLLTRRGGFWRMRERLPQDTLLRSGIWPSVTAIVPARDEADVIGAAVGSLLRQDYPGRLHVILIDDNSRDGTAEAARTVAADSGHADRLTVVRAGPRAPGWVGKVHAMQQGLAAMPTTAGAAPDRILFTDADICHPPDGLRRLAAHAEGDGRDLASLMVRLHCRNSWERLLIPAFVFFFAKLYPFAWVADGRVAAAAGGCMLVRRTALERAGGLAPIRDALIDDCALAALLRRHGSRLWLGLADDTVSLRPYSGLGEIWRMIARSAYTQLRHSPMLLAGTVAGMGFLYLLPPALLLGLPWHGDLAAASAGGGAWLLMAASCLPILRFYRQPRGLAVALPLVALLYTAMTVDSARRHWLGRGGVWKGRVSAGARKGPPRTGP